MAKGKKTIEEKERIQLERANKLLERYGVCDVATFDDLMLEILDKHTISYERIINHIPKDL